MARWTMPLAAILLVLTAAAPEPFTAVAQTWHTMAWVMLGFLTVVWVVGTVMRNHSIMDIVYPLTPWLGTVALWWWQGADRSPSSLLLLTGITLWAFRLAGYVSIRYLPHGEEARYAKWRARGGDAWWWRSYIQIYLTQGAIVWLWCLPLAFALNLKAPLGPWAALACVAWVIGFVFEVGGDWQMHRFRSDPRNKGQVMDRGLWGWCRHPNYFGESMTWLAWGLMALAAPWGWLGLPSVVMVFWFMNQGSALSMTERYMLKTKPGYADYMARVPAFFPRPPRPQAPQ